MTVKELRKFFVWLPILWLAGMLLSCEGMDEVRSLQVGDRVPIVHLVGSDGRMFDTTSPLTRPGVIVFFHTSCPDCQQELPVLQKVYEAYKSEVAFLAVGRRQGEAEIAAYWQSQGFSMPYYPDTDASIYGQFASSGVPRVYIIDRRGIIVRTFDDAALPVYDSLSVALDEVLSQVGGKAE